MATASHAGTHSSPLAQAASPRGGRPMPGQQPTFSKGPPGETPAEKIARMRAEWRAKNIAPLSLWDRTVVRGRRIADLTHFYFVTFLAIFTGTHPVSPFLPPASRDLLGLTACPHRAVLCMGYASFCMVDLFKYNRRKKAEFHETQKILYQTALQESREALARGEATQAHLDMLENERLAVLDEERLRKKSYSREIFNYLFRREEFEKEKPVNEIEAMRKRFPLREEPPPKEQGAEAVRAVAGVDGSSKDRETSTLKAVEDKRREGEKAAERRGVQGGPLDFLAEAATSSSAHQRAEHSAREQRTWSSRVSSLWR